MKKILTALTSVAFLALTASADIARVEMGVGAWAQTPSGELSYINAGATATDKSDETEEVQAYVWALIKHPIPVVPNLRLEYVSLKNTGVANGTFKEFTVTAGKTSLEMTQIDVIPYYNILDNTFWSTVDIGIDFKVAEMTYDVKNGTDTATGTYHDSESVVIPLAYVRGRVEIPVTNIGLEADVKYIAYNTSYMYDVRAKIDYTFDIFPVVQPAIEVGYRVQKIKIDDDSIGKSDINLEFAGFYAGFMLRF
ncbi:TIGR04219 family outer membrane beta-barrel protein [Sulfurimonas sp. CS5]|uniref:TIGR04219 family outer membrane beta-barrel protein n=1 Tax=Sulfurimonas sp. CS5 TaxID=3391145 RepID=UPI0039E827BA